MPKQTALEWALQEIDKASTRHSARYMKCLTPRQLTDHRNVQKWRNATHEEKLDMLRGEFT